MSKAKMTLALVLLSAAFVACSSEPKVAELPATADPQTELNHVSDRITQARQDQVDMLSPHNFQSAQKSYDKAVRDRSNNDSQKTVLHDIAEANAYLDKANATVAVSTQLLKGPADARKDALTAKANEYFPKETEKADREFKSLTEDVEDHSTSSAEKKGGSLEATYRKLELNSIKKDKLSTAENEMHEALNEGAKKLTPKTYIWTDRRYATDVATIEANPHDTAAVNAAGADATASADRLLKMVRVAKGATAKNPEDFAEQQEMKDRSVAQTEGKLQNNLSQTNSELNQTQAELAATQEKLNREAQHNGQLQSQVRLDQQYDLARKEFNSQEAEVYKEGDKLLLRLKGLSFGNNKSVIDSKNFPLLAKVQKVIHEVGPSAIVVEGHTDSTGAKKANEELSEKRAQSVQSYLVANNTVPADKITAEGYGDSKPVASNKTAEGRAQNRRVDLIITSDAAPADSTQQ